MRKSEEKLIVLTFRVSTALDQEIEDLISKRRWSKSDFIREAVKAKLEKERAPIKVPNPMPVGD